MEEENTVSIFQSTAFSSLLVSLLFQINEPLHQLLIYWYILYYAQETKMTWLCGYQNCTTKHILQVSEILNITCSINGVLRLATGISKQISPVLQLKKNISRIWILENLTYLFKGENIVSGTGRNMAANNVNSMNIPMYDEQQHGRTVTSQEGLSAQPTVQSSCEAWGRYT